MARWSPLILAAYAVTTTELVGRSVKKRISVGRRALYPPPLVGGTHGTRDTRSARARTREMKAVRACARVRV